MLTLQRLSTAVFVAAVAALSLNAKGESDMATLNDLVGQIENAALRERIEEEIERVVKQKKFGLVFERSYHENRTVCDDFLLHLENAVSRCEQIWRNE